jgi:hypothetical protein
MKKGANQWDRWFWRSKITVKCRYYKRKSGRSKRSLDERAACIHPYSLPCKGEAPASCKGDMETCEIPRGKRMSGICS